MATQRGPQLTMLSARRQCCTFYAASGALELEFAVQNSRVTDYFTQVVS